MVAQAAGRIFASTFLPGIGQLDLSDEPAGTWMPLVSAMHPPPHQDRNRKAFSGAVLSGSAISAHSSGRLRILPAAIHDAGSATT